MTQLEHIEYSLQLNAICHLEKYYFGTSDSPRVKENIEISSDCNLLWHYFGIHGFDSKLCQTRRS